MSEFDDDRKIIDAATPGPWNVQHQPGSPEWYIGGDSNGGFLAWLTRDVTFIMAARAPAALNEIDRLKRELEELKRAVELLHIELEKK